MSTQVALDEKTLRIARQMKNGLTIKDRVYMFKKYKQCFIGKTAVSWMMKNDLAATRQEATAIGKKLLTADVIAHVMDEHDFEDGFLYYRFKKDVDKLTMISEKERLAKELAQLQEENDKLKKEAIRLRSNKEAWQSLRQIVKSAKLAEEQAPPEDTRSGLSLSVVIVGATSTYAWKEIYPALFFSFHQGSPTRKDPHCNIRRETRMGYS